MKILEFKGWIGISIDKFGSGKFTLKVLEKTIRKISRRSLAGERGRISERIFSVNHKLVRCLAVRAFSTRKKTSVKSG